MSFRSMCSVLRVIRCRNVMVTSSLNQYNQHRNLMCSTLVNKLCATPNPGFCLSHSFATNLTPAQIASYEEVKDLPNHPEKLLIDVREPSELVEFGQIPTSINIPLKTLEDALKLTSEKFFETFGRTKPSSENELIFHCKGGGRAGRATELALTLGFQNARNYKGSWMEWAEKEGIKK
ncbi:unnamed protein product [Diamesa serratosioi]